jgi:hypothetical protein
MIKDYSLRTYLAEVFRGTQKHFAHIQGVSPNQAHRWVNTGYIVVDGRLYSPRRKLIAK